MQGPLLGAGVLVLAVYALTGVTQVNADEVAVVRRFGRVLPDDLGPGLYWRWPWPVEEVTKVQPNRIRRVEVGFRTLPGRSAGRDDSLAWGSPHGASFQRYADESVVITGDDNLADVLATVHYSIRNIRVYLFEVGDPEGALRQATEAALRDTAAGRAFAALLTDQRKEFQEQLLARLRERCDALGPDGLGVQVEAVWLQELHPPPEVVPSFHKVPENAEKGKAEINKAEEERIDKLEKATVTRKKEADEGRVERHRIERQARAALFVFEELWKARRRLDLAAEGRCYLEALLKLADGKSQEEARQTYARLRQEELRRQARWSDERMRLEVLGRNLPEREMVVIDASGPFASFLYALDQLREVIPLFSPPERALPARAPRAEQGEGP